MNVEESTAETKKTETTSMAAGLQTNHPNQVSNPRLQLPSNIAERL